MHSPWVAFKPWTVQGCRGLYSLSLTSLSALMQLVWGPCVSICILEVTSQDTPIGCCGLLRRHPSSVPGIAKNCVVQELKVESVSVPSCNQWHVF